jgi:hypothetical protein
MYGSLDQSMDDKFFIQKFFVIFQEFGPKWYLSK